MATTKTAKVEADIAKVKAKIAEYHVKLKELEGKKVAIENSEIVGIVRSVSVPLDSLAALLQAARSGENAPEATSGHDVWQTGSVQKSGSENERTGGSETQ